MPDQPDVDEVRDWMRRAKRGYAAAAKRFGLTEAQVRRLCGRNPAPHLSVVQGPMPVSSADLDRETFLERCLQDFERLAASAEAAGSWGAASQARKELVRVREALDALRETKRRTEDPGTLKQQRDESRLEIRRMRIAATEAGSFDSAARLLRIEHELLGALQAEQDAEAASELARKTIAELEAEAEKLRADRLR